VLVTGGAGFIGSHLCEALLGQGWEVYALDDLSTGSIARSSCCLFMLERPSIFRRFAWL